MFDYVSVDLETTGFNCETCDIIEIGAWKIKKGVVTDKFCTLVRPVLYIPRTVQEITGITMEDIADCETIEPVLIEFFDWCEDLPFLGHNLPFDYKFLKFKGKNLGLDFSLKHSRQGIDTLNLCRKYKKFPSNKLRDVAESMQLQLHPENSSFHRAGYDSYITKLIYDRFLYEFPKVLDVNTPCILDSNDSKYGKAVNNDTLSFT